MAIKFYKPEAAKASRGVTALSLGLLLLYGAVALYDSLAAGWWLEPISGLDGLLGDEFPLAPRGFAAVLMMGLSAFGVFVLCNHPRYVDFLVETEAELRKVTWPTRPEIVSSSTVVVLVTVILGIYIFAVDYIIGWIKLHLDIRNLF